MCILVHIHRQTIVGVRSVKVRRVLMCLFNYSLKEGKLSLTALCNGLPSLDYKRRGRGAYDGSPFFCIEGFGFQVPLSPFPFFLIRVSFFFFFSLSGQVFVQLCLSPAYMATVVNCIVAFVPCNGVCLMNLVLVQFLVMLVLHTLFLLLGEEGV